MNNNKGGELERVFDPLGTMLRRIKEAKTDEERKQRQRELVLALQRRFTIAEDDEGLARKQKAVELEAQMGLLGPVGSLLRRRNVLERLRRWTEQEALVLSGLEPYTMTLESFQATTPSLKRSLKVAKEYVAKQYPPFLTLVGKPGVGKSHLAVAIGRSLCTAGVFVLYRPEREFLGELRHAIEGGPNPMLDFEACDLLILDDLGVESATPWARARVDSLIDARYMSQRMTIVCTNASPEEISPRVASRLRDITVGKTVFIDAPDFRSTRGKAN